MNMYETIKTLAKPIFSFFYQNVLVFMTFIFFTTTSLKINSRKKVEKALQAIQIDDQKFRGKVIPNNLLGHMKFQDRINLMKVIAIIRKYNWPFDGFITADGARTVFLVVQHSNLKTQEEFLPLIKAAFQLEKLKANAIALLEDRIATQKDLPQIYGTQVTQDSKSGMFSLYPIEDIAGLDQRRKTMGLGPISEYLKNWDIDADSQNIK